MDGSRTANISPQRGDTGRHDSRTPEMFGPARQQRRLLESGTTPGLVSSTPVVLGPACPTMPPRRLHPPRIVALVLLSFLAQGLLPRATWFVHRHAGGEHDHVHAWDGSRVAGSSASLGDLLPHDHDHGTDHHDHPDTGAATGHDHGHPHAAGLRPAHQETVAGRGARLATTSDGDRRATGHAASDARRRNDAAARIVAARDAGHSHAQAPFQIAVASDIARIAAPRLHLVPAPVVTAAPCAPQVPALRARGPPCPFV